MLISAEFLEETASTHVGHTALSYAFVNNFALSDGLAFLTETIVPASLKMVEASKSFDKVDRSPYSAAFGTSTSFTDQALPHGRLSRQFDHFMRCIANDTGNGLLSILRRLNLNGDKEALVVDVSGNCLQDAVVVPLLMLRAGFMYLPHHRPNSCSSASAAVLRSPICQRAPANRRQSAPGITGSTHPMPPPIQS